LKRLFDIIVAIIAIAIMSPLILCIAVVIRLALGKPVLFTQVRPGRWGKPFTVIKFRTMRDACDIKGHALPDAQRMTGFGRFLRSSSLDELPELWNVLRGEMSLVGPRPLLMEYLPLYSSQQARRHDVRPGMTGWAQINGRNAISWSEKFNLDVWYVDNESFLLDLKILVLTIVRVFRRDGITATDNVTTPKFRSGQR
jgi:lipopolysaccharide/colanic/teichoic acid biosynthesis glycosyltransferase